MTIFDILLAHPLANLIGVACVVLGATWPLYKTRARLLWAQAAVHVAFGAHFYFLGATSGALMNVLGLTQVLLALPLGRQPGFKTLYIAFLPLIALGAWWTWGGPESAFVALGFALFSVARYQTNTLLMRWIMAAAICSVTVHDLLVLSIPALTADTLSMATSIVMIRREHRLSFSRAGL